jgi:hypothetical protein
MEAELIGHAQTHGWSQLDPAAAAKAVLKAHLEAKKMIGVPADQLIRLPKDMNDPAALHPIYERLGHPKEAKDYDFTTVKHKDGRDLNEALTAAMRNTAFEHRLPKDAAANMAKAVVEHMDATAAAEAGEKAAKLQAGRDRLKTDWAAAPEVFMLMAQSAANRLGVTPEEVSALESVVGYDRIMNMFKTIGEKLGEHSYLMPKPGGGNMPMTKEMATAKKAELMGDAEWTKRYLAGGAAEKREMDSIHTIMFA